MNTIKELDEWLNDSSLVTELKINKTSIVFIKRDNISRINISIGRQGEELTGFNFYINSEMPSAESLLRCAIQLASYNAQTLNNAVDDIKNCMEGEE